MQIEIQDPKLTTDRCRYCLMCRHVCPVTAVTRNETTSPHGWGLLMASVERGLTSWIPDTVNVLYQCADCGLCQAHCATDQPLPLAINAARATVVEQKQAPASVYELQGKLQRWGNPYVEQSPSPVSGRAEAALIVGAVGRHFEPGSVNAALKLLAAAGVSAVPIANGRSSPYLAHTLGLSETARTLAGDTLAEIEQLGARTVFVLSPGEIYSYQTLLTSLDLSWPEGVELREVTEFLANRLAAQKLSFRAADLGNYTFYDPDHSVRVPERWAAPRNLLAALSGTPPIELFWRKERAAPCGAGGGLPFTQPELSMALAQARLDDAKARGIATIITDAPQVLFHLGEPARAAGIELKSLFGLLEENLEK